MGVTANINGNADKAFEWFLKAAEQSDADSQYEVARIYFADHKFEEAFKWYMKAAKQGHSDSQGMVGMFYASGLLEDRNLEKTKEWLNKAAMQGNKAAIEAIQIFNNISEQE